MDSNKLLDILQQFSVDIVDDVNRIEQSLKNGDLNNAREIVHKLKGVAASVGAVDLHRATEKFNAELKSGEYSIDTLNLLYLVHSQTRTEIARYVRNLPESRVLTVN